MINSFKKFINCSVKVELQDKRFYTGVLLTVDEFLNIILDETEEFRKFKKKAGFERRKLGLCMFRGSSIVNIKRSDEDKKAEKEKKSGEEIKIENK